MKLNNWLSSIYIIFIISLDIFAKPVVSADLPKSLGRLTEIIGQYSNRSLEYIGSDLEPFFEKNITLVKKSAALISASWVNPRPILWNFNEGVVLTWKSHESLEGPDDIEAHFWDPTEKRLRLIAIKELDWKQGKANWQEPTRCLECHGMHSKPIWSEYNQWTEAFGQDNDRVGPQEIQALNFWIKTDNSRINTLKEQALSQYIYYGEVDNYGQSLLYRRPNLRLTMLLNRMNVQSIFSRLNLNSKKAEQLLKSLVGCKGSDSLASLFKLESLTDFDFTLFSMNDSSSRNFDSFSESFYDGSATTLELLAGQIIEKNNPHIQRYLKSHFEKYSIVSLENQQSLKYFQEADSWGRWLTLPFQKNQKTRAQNRIYINEAHLINIQNICKTTKEKI